MGHEEVVEEEATLGKDAYQVSLRLSGYTPFMVSRLGDYPQAVISSYDTPSPIYS